MLQYCSVFKDGLCAAVRWRRCSQHVVHLVCGPLSHVLLLVHQPWAAFMLHGCFNVSTQAHLLSDYSTFCTCWHHFQAFLLCQLLFSASLLSRGFNIASLTLRSWQWGGQSMMTVLHWGGEGLPLLHWCCFCNQVLSKWCCMVAQIMMTLQQTADGWRSRCVSQVLCRLLVEPFPVS